MKTDRLEFATGHLRLTVEIVRSARKTLALELHPHGRNVVRAPHCVSDKEIERFLATRAAWIEQKIAVLRSNEKNAVLPQENLTAEEIQRLTESAQQAVRERVAFFAPLVGVTVEKITVRHQVSRWGSCSAKGNVSFNCLLMLCPPRVLDYVVVHELCHRKEMNHSLRFWEEVGRILPSFEVERRWLKEHGRELIARLRG